MSSKGQDKQRISTDRQQLKASTAFVPDPSWRGLYKAGGISVFLYIVLGIIVPAVIFLSSNYNTSMNGEEILRFIASHKFWWIIVQTLTLGPSILAIVVFVALFMALKQLNKSYTAIAAVVAITCQILFIAYYPVIMGLTYLSDQYAVATTDSGRVVLVTAAEALLAQNNAFNPLYETIFAFSILIFSLVMLKGVFHKVIGYLGIVTCAAAIIGLVLQPIVGIGYLWWWFFFMIWFIAVGWKLFRLGGANNMAKTRINSNSY